MKNSAKSDIIRKSPLYWIFIVYIGVVLLAPKEQVVSAIGLRLEDLVGLVSLVGIFVEMQTDTENDNILRKTIICFGIYALISNGLAMMMAGSDYIEVYLLIAKEISMISLSLLAIRGLRRSWFGGLRMIVSIVGIQVAVSCAYLIIGYRGVYGVSPYGHEDSPLSAGFIYFGCFLFIHLSRVVFKGKWLWILMQILCGAFVLLSGSKTAVVALLSFVFVRMIQMRYYKILLVCFAGAVGGLQYIANELVTPGASVETIFSGIKRLAGLLDPVRQIQNRGIWFKMDWVDATSLLFGKYQAGQIMADKTFSMGMAMDNQFIYLIVKLGAIGIFFYACIMIQLLKLVEGKEARDLAIAVILSFLLSGMGAEVLNLSVSGSIFWLVLGTLVAVSRKTQMGLEGLV